MYIVEHYIKKKHRKYKWHFDWDWKATNEPKYINVEIRVKPLKLIRQPSYKKLFPRFKYENLESCVSWEMEMDEKPGNLDIKSTGKAEVFHGVVIIRAWKWWRDIGLPSIPSTGFVWSTHKPFFQAEREGPQLVMTFDIHDSPPIGGMLPMLEEVLEGGENFICWKPISSQGVQQH